MLEITIYPGEKVKSEVGPLDEAQGVSYTFTCDLDDTDTEYAALAEALHIKDEKDFEDFEYCDDTSVLAMLHDLKHMGFISDYEIDPQSITDTLAEELDKATDSTDMSKEDSLIITEDNSKPSGYKVSVQRRAGTGPERNDESDLDLFDLYDMTIDNRRVNNILSSISEISRA